MSEVIKEGTWKCPNCGAKCRGRDVNCTGCGQAREGVEFEYDETAAEVTDRAELSIAKGGADWVCAFCGTSNRASAPKCKQCAAESADGKVRQVSEVDESRGGVALSVAPAAALPGWLGYLMLALGVLFAMFLFVASREHQATVVVSAVAWDRSIDVERQLPVIQSDWRLPAGARERSRNREIRRYVSVPAGTQSVRKTYSERVQTGTRKVKTGTKNMGNGYFKETYRDEPVYSNRQREKWVRETVYRQDPIYDTKYTFEVMLWKPIRTERASGADNSPKWPDVKLSEGEREGKRQENYNVTLEDAAKHKSYTIQPSATDFSSLEVGTRRAAVIDGLGVFQRLAPAVEK